MNKLIESILTILLLSIGASQSFAEDKVTFYHYDALGSPVATTDKNGNVLWREEYSPWGEKLLKEDATHDNVRDYTGHVHDKETGLTYMQARYYDPQIGRFMGVDPVGFQEGNTISFNRYGYANNNPFGFSDPNGEQPFAIMPDPGFFFRSEVHGFTKGVAATVLDVATLDYTLTNGDLVIGSSLKPDEEFGYLVGRYATTMGLGKIATRTPRMSGGTYRANMHSSNWEKVNINDAISKFSGKNPTISNTSSGKKLVTNNETGIQIVHDVKGNYFRINDTNIKSKRSFLDMDGKVPNNKTTDKGTQKGRTQSEYNEATHFNMDE